MNNGPHEVFGNTSDAEKCSTTVKVKLGTNNLPVLQCPLDSCTFTTHVEGTLLPHVVSHLKNIGQKKCELRYHLCPTCTYFTTRANLINEHISLTHRGVDSDGEAQVIVKWQMVTHDLGDVGGRDVGRVSPYPSAQLETCSSASSPPPVVSLEGQYSRQVSSPSPSQQDLAIPLPNEAGSASLEGFNGDCASPPPPPPPPPFQQSNSTSSLVNSIALPIPNRPPSPPKKGGPNSCGGGEAKAASATATAAAAAAAAAAASATAAALPSVGLHGSRKRKRAIPARCQQPPESTGGQASNDDLASLTSWPTSASPGSTLMLMRPVDNSGSPREGSNSEDNVDGVRSAADGFNNNNVKQLGHTLLNSIYAGSIAPSIRAMISSAGAGVELNGFSTTTSQDQALDMTVRTSNGGKELASSLHDDKSSDAPLDTTSLLLTATSGSIDIHKVLSRLPSANLSDAAICLPDSPDGSEQSGGSPPPDSQSGSEAPLSVKSNAGGGPVTTTSGQSASKPHRQNFTQQQNDILNRWYQRHSDKPYPSTEQTKELANECRLSYSQVKKWFANKRARTSKGGRAANGSGVGLGDATSPMDCTPSVSFPRTMLDLAQAVPPSSTSSSPKMASVAVSMDPLRSPGAAALAPLVNGGGGGGSGGGSGSTAAAAAAAALPERFPFMLSPSNAAFQMQRLLQTSLASLASPITLASTGVIPAVADVKKESDRSDGEELDEEEMEKKN